ncbi:MAG: glycosyltransferase [Patescibacteria group bacterium]
MKTNPGISVVIRSCNESAALKNLIYAIWSQQYNGRIEIVVVDNESTDDTAEVAKKLGAKVINIPRDEFTFPKSINLGVRIASHEIVVLTVAHALPLNDLWLSSAAHYFSAPSVAGVFAHCLPAKKRTLSEIIFYYPNYFWDRINSPRILKKREMGIMGGTNCALRRSLWELNNFDQGFELGGEDSQWAVWAINRGYKIVMDTNFTVFHSHHLGFLGLLKQIKYWLKSSQYQKFDRAALKFRGKVFHNE